MPTDVCVDPSNGNVYITMGAKNSISILSKDGNLIGHLGDFASSESELNTPCGVTVFGENVLVSDSGNHRIVVYNKLSRKYVSYCAWWLMLCNVADKFRHLVLKARFQENCADQCNCAPAYQAT